MKSNKTLKKEMNINATQAEVWKALTDPIALKQMMFGCDIVTSWEIGSEILFKGQWEGKEFIDKGHILNFEEGKSYAYDYWSTFSELSDSPENYSTIAFELEETNNGTLLYLEQHNFATESAYTHSDKNWDQALSVLKEMLEKE
ncbi:SRPBCC domain-containing protein [Bacteroidia bacterium]|nr:SRPBCC domain-containing protein [Bacteroidia bacterium]